MEGILRSSPQELKCPYFDHFLDFSKNVFWGNLTKLLFRLVDSWKNPGIERIRTSYDCSENFMKKYWKTKKLEQIIPKWKKICKIFFKFVILSAIDLLKIFSLFNDVAWNSIFSNFGYFFILIPTPIITQFTLDLIFEDVSIIIPPTFFLFNKISLGHL